MLLFHRFIHSFLEAGDDRMTDTGKTIPASCDVAVIGAGIGGLTAAAILAEAGLDVAVFEANSRAGGYLCGFERSGFIFDSAIQWLNQCRPGGFAYRLFSHLGDDFPRCKPLRRVCRCKGDSFDYTLTANPAELRDRLIREFPGEGKGIRALFRDSELLGLRFNVLNDKIRTSETMSFFEKLAHGIRMTWWTLPIWKHVKGSADKCLGRYFRSPALRKLFCREKSFMSIVMPIGWAYTGNYQAPPEGGSQAFIQWLCRKIESSGSRIFLGRRVARVNVDERNQVAGISLEDGSDVSAQYVVAACDLQTLYDQMVPQGSVPDRLRAAVRDADLYYSNFSIFMGLDCDPATLGFNEEILYLVREDVSREEQSGGDPRKTALTVIAPSVRDPTLAPKGKGTLVIHCAAYMDNHARWKTEEGLRRGEAYRAFKKEFADILIDRVETGFVPGLREHVEVMEIATPVTYWRYTGNKDGSAMGTSPTAKNIKARVAHYKTPIRNLLLGGHWAEYGGGVPMAMKAGANASLIILKERNCAKYEALKNVMDGKAVESVTIGIPRALCYFLYPGLWETFFSELGMKVIVSRATTRQTVERAGLISESEHCLPVKMFDSHVAEIIGKVDMVFVPRILSSLAGHISCPKLGALPDAAKAQFGKDTEVLTLDIDEDKIPLEESLCSLGRKLKADDAAIRAAIRISMRAMRAGRKPPPPRGGRGGKRILILGHPYNLHDAYISGPILSKLDALNVGVDLVAYDAHDVESGPIKWDTCSIMHDRVRRLDPKACAGVIQLSSFNCGCDSIVGEIFRGMLRDKGIPYMTLVLDEHSAQAGVDTRLEAFVDSMGW